MFLEILDTNTIPAQGTSIGDAIRLALKSFNPDDKTGKAIVLLTDGEDHRSDPEGAARLAREQGVVVFTVGIGTAKGEVIKKRDDQGNVTEFLKHKGEMVLSRLDEGLLSKMSALTGGRYFRASSSDREIDEIAEIINGFAKKEFGSRVFENRQERYQWFLLLGLALLVFQFFRNENPGQAKRIADFLNSDPFQNVKWLKRKGQTSALIFLMLVSLPAPAWPSLKENIRRGTDLIKHKDWAGARGAFESSLIDAPESAEIHFNIGNTYYFEGNFEEAKRSYEQALLMANDPVVKSRIFYNLGHLIFHMGDRDGAIERFKETLRHDHRDEDAKYNIEYIRAGLTPKNPPQPQEQKEPPEPQDQPSPAEGSDEERKGEISKEQAEQILQMMQEQEKDQMRDAKDMLRFQQSDDKEESESHEDW